MTGICSKSRLAQQKACQDYDVSLCCICIQIQILIKILMPAISAPTNKGETIIGPAYGPVDKA